MYKRNISFKSVTLLPIISIFSLFLFFQTRKIFPEKFFLDNITLRKFMENPQIYNDKGFYNTAIFFKILGFSQNSNYVIEQLFAWLIFVGILTILVIKFKVSLFNIYNAVLLLLFSIFYLAYNSQMSKDLALIILIFLYLFFFYPKKASTMWVIWVLFYGIFFRGYWILVLFIMMAQIVMEKIHLKTSLRMLILLLLNIFIQIGYKLMVGYYLTDLRTQVNMGREFSEYAKSMISNPLLNTSFFANFVNFFYGLINLFIPIDGLSSFNELTYYLWIWLILFLFYTNKNSNRKFILFFFISFINIQAYFEPDIGSVLRHQIFMIPLILIYTNTDKEIRS